MTPLHGSREKKRDWDRMRRRLVLPLLVPIIWVSLAAASIPTTDAIQKWHAREVRVRSIARRILASNLQACTVKQKDYGFTTVTINVAAPAELQAVWAMALQLGDGYTAVTVFADGPAQALGMRLGDTLVSVNGTRWSDRKAEQGAFRDALAKGLLEPQVHLTVRRADQEISLELEGQDICKADAILRTSQHSNAQVFGSTIVVDAGLEELLTNDDELAFVIAHEAAHVFLGHSAPDQQQAPKVSATRSAMEKAADVLGIRLAARAGYMPEAAAVANPKLANANRGPISRMLDLHGPYMSTRDRTEFLKAQAAAVRAESFAH
jgi:membrane-associated protease RseP (regulator of RpoE activity)